MSQLPAAVTIPELPAGTTPSGSEQLEAVQGGNSVALTVTQIASGPMSPQSANTVLAGPISGGAATPAFRVLVVADLPALTQRATSTNPIVIVSGDRIINFNINAGSPTCQLPAAASRNGLSLTFKDSGGHCATHNLTFSFTGGELADGDATVTLTNDYQEITFRPYNDGVNSGWAIA